MSTTPTQTSTQTSTPSSATSSDNTTALKAADYDANVEATIPHHATFQREVLRFVRSLQPTPARWLDTGCGTGTLVARALDAFPSTRFVLADPSSAMLSEAKAKLAGAGERVALLPPAGSAELSTAASAELERPFDVVTAVLCHHYLEPEGRRAAVQACHRLLGDGGLFVAFENVRPGTGSDGELDVAMRYWRAYQVEMGKSAAMADAHLARFGREYFPITVEAHLALLREVGFRTVGLLWYSYLQAGVFGVK